MNLDLDIGDDSSSSVLVDPRSRGLEVDLLGGLGARIVTAQTKMREARANERQIMADMPIDFELTGIANTTTAQFNVATVTRIVLPQTVPLGFTWELRHILLQVLGQGKVSDPNGSTNTGSTVSGISTVSGAAAAAATLTASGLAYLMGFTVSPAGAWPVGNNVVTVSNLAGGTQTFEIPGGTTNPVTASWPQPGIPAPYASATVAVPAMVGGPAYTINAFGTILGSGYIDVAGTIYKGAPLPQYSATVSNGLPQFAIVPSCGVPFEQWYTDGSHLLKQGETIYADVWNAIGSPVALTCRFHGYARRRAGKSVTAE